MIIITILKVKVIVIITKIQSVYQNEIYTKDTQYNNHNIMKLIHKVINYHNLIISIQYHHNYYNSNANQYLINKAKQYLIQYIMIKRTILKTLTITIAITITVTIMTTIIHFTNHHYLINSRYHLLEINSLNNSHHILRIIIVMTNKYNKMIITSKKILSMIFKIVQLLSLKKIIQKNSSNQINSTTTIKLIKQHKTKYQQLNNLNFLHQFPSLSSIQFVDQDHHQTIDTRKIVNYKNRFPYSFIGKVVSQFYNNSNQKIKEVNDNLNPQKNQGKTKYGMACLIGPGILITDAHVVSEKETNKKADYVSFYLNHTTQKDTKLNKQNLLAFKVDKILIHPQYFTKPKSQTQRHDIAILILRQSRYLPKQNMRIKWNYSLDRYPKKQLKFITSKIISQPNVFQLFQSDDLPIGEFRSLLLYKNTTAHGDSGSPVIFIENVDGFQRYYLVGLHKGAVAKANCCILLNSYLKNTKDIFSEIIESQNLLMHKLKQVGNYQPSISEILIRIKTLQQRNLKLQNYNKLMLQRNNKSQQKRYQQNQPRQQHKQQSIKQIPKKVQQHLLRKNLQQLEIKNCQQQLIIDTLKEKNKQDEIQIRKLKDQLITQLRYRQQLQQLLKNEKNQAIDFKKFHFYQKQENTKLLFAKEKKLTQLEKQYQLIKEQNLLLVEQNKNKTNLILQLQNFKTLSTKNVTIGMKKRISQSKQNTSIVYQNEQFQQINQQNLGSQQLPENFINSSSVNLNQNNDDMKQTITTKRKLINRKNCIQNNSDTVIKQLHQNQQTDNQDKSCLHKFYQCLQNLFKQKPKVLPIEIGYKSSLKIEKQTTNKRKRTKSHQKPKNTKNNQIIKMISD